MGNSLPPVTLGLSILAALLIVYAGSTWLFERLLVSAVLTAFLASVGLGGIVIAGAPVRGYPQVAD